MITKTLYRTNKTFFHCDEYNYGSTKEIKKNIIYNFALVVYKTI